MKFGLFAADEVGYEIAKFFKENNENVSCLVLDSKDGKSLNSMILSSVNTQEIFYSDSLYEPSTLEKLQNMEIDWMILVWWPYIIKENLIRIPKMGCFNLHPSYLPYNRGRHPYFWSIVEEVPFGVTLHFVDPGIDNGNIIFQEVIEKSWEDTGATLYEKSKKTIVELFKKKFPEIKKGNLLQTEQSAENGSLHYAREIEGASEIFIDGNYTARELLNLIRGRSGFPDRCWFKDNGQKYEVSIQIRKVAEK